MGVRYMVSVVRVEDVEGAESRYATVDTTLFEATMGDASRLARFAPVEVLEVLAAEAGVSVAVVWPSPGEGVALVDVPPPAERTDSANLDGPTPEALAVEQAKPKRTRRTRAEIDAAKAASEARLNGEPEQSLVAEVAPEPAGESAPPAPAKVEQPAAPAEAPNPFMTQAPVASVASGPAQFNPFE